jgi:Tfp pilus assembly protein PilO
MKVKTLLTPLIIVIVVAVFIWLVYPAYSNGTSGVSENYAKLKSEQIKLAELRSKSENANGLSAQISSLQEKNILYTFVPESMKEEEIINSLTNLASTSGLLLFEATVNQPAKESSDELIQNTGGLPLPDGTVALPPAPKAQNLKTDIKLVGSYEKIKEFLGNLGKMGRSNDFEILAINNTSGGGTIDLNALSVVAAVDFNFLKKGKLNEFNITDPVFSNAKLETKIIEDIKSQKNAQNFQLNVDQKGKNNLFQP